MTTYNTYQEAKISMPLACIIHDTDNDSFFGMPTKAGTTLNPHGGCKFAEPADYCMTVEKFLADGHKFVDGRGDAYLDHEGVVRFIGDDGYSHYACCDIGNIGEPENSYILRAAALEEKKSQNGFESRCVVIKEKPRTKVEYVKCGDSIWHLESDFKAGDLFAFDGDDDYVQIETESDFTISHSNDNIYRRIETQMTERELFIEEAMRFTSFNTQQLLGQMFDSGKFKLVN